MVAITNTTSLTFLKEAIDATLTEAENSLEAFSDDPSRQEELARCAEDFQQLRGICQVVELPAAALMSEEMSLAARELREKQSDARVQALSNAIVLLTRYFDYVQLKNRTLPALLIGGINELRRAGGKALIQESHFFLRLDILNPTFHLSPQKNIGICIIEAPFLFILSRVEIIVYPLLLSITIMS